MKTINALVIRDKEIPVVNKKGTWILPGGKPDLGESDYGCLIREISVEGLPGTNVLVGNYYNTFYGITPHSKKSVESKCYFCDVAGEIGEAFREISGKRFVDSSYFDRGLISEVTEKVLKSLEMEGLIK